MKQASAQRNCQHIDIMHVVYESLYPQTIEGKCPYKTNKLYDEWKQRTAQYTHHPKIYCAGRYLKEISRRSLET